MWEQFSEKGKRVILPIAGQKEFSSRKHSEGKLEDKGAISNTQQWCCKEQITPDKLDCFSDGITKLVASGDVVAEIHLDFSIWHNVSQNLTIVIQLDLDASPITWTAN